MNNEDKNPRLMLQKFVKATPLVISLVLLALSVYLLFQNMSLKKQLQSKGIDLEKKEAELTVREEEIKLYSANTLQELLDVFCKNLELEKLPLQLDRELINIVPYSGESIWCGSAWSDKQNTTGKFLVINTDNERLYLHDGEFYDEGHGGYSHFMPKGTVIKKDEKKQISVFLATSEAGIYVGQNRVIARGQKTLYLKNGNPYYVTTDTVAVEGKDIRLVNILNKYASECPWPPPDGNSTKQCINSKESLTKANEEIVRVFFSNPLNLSSPEKDTVDLLEKILEAISKR